MSIKWIWGFESGASREFYSGSGWDRCWSAPYPDAAYAQIGYFSDTENQVDYSANFPHQPPTKAGGGQYSLKVEPGTVLGFDDGQVTWQTFQVLSPSVWNNTDVPSTGTLSFSIYNNLDTSEWPVTGAGSTDPAEQFGMVQRFLSLYPDDIEVTDITSGSFGAGLGLMTGGMGPEVPPMLQLFMVRSSGVVGSTNPIYDGVFAFCVTQTGPVTGVAPWGAAFDYLTAATVGGYSFLPAITGALKTGALAGYDSSPSFGGYGYTGSEGTILPVDDWSKVAVEYHPHPTLGSLKVSVNGVDIIDVSNVPTGYTASADVLSGGNIYDNQKWGRVGFTSHGFGGNPNPWFLDTSSSLKPATFWYDHVCAFDNGDSNDWHLATSSIFVQGVAPVQDHETGPFLADNSQTGSLFDFIDDQNYFMNNNYLVASASAPTGKSCDFYYNKLNFAGKAGATAWDMNTVSSVIGVNIISAVSGAGISGSSVYRGCDPGCSPFETGSSFPLAGKQFIYHTSGSDPDGRSWNYLTGSGAELITAGVQYST